MSLNTIETSRALQNLLAHRPLAVRSGLDAILHELDLQTGEGFSDFTPKIVVGATEWDRFKNTILIFENGGFHGLPDERLAILKRLGHWIYDASLTYTEIWSFSSDEPPHRVWTVRDEIIERSIRLTTDSEGRMGLEQEIHAVGVQAQPAAGFLNDAQRHSYKPKTSGNPKSGTVRLSVFLDRSAKQAIRLLAAAKNATDSAIVNEAISLYLTSLTRGAAAPLLNRRCEPLHSRFGNRRTSYIIDSTNREAMNFLKSSKGYSYSDVARAAIDYRVALEDSGNSLRMVSAELVQSQSDSRDERASELLDSDVMGKLSNVVRSIAFDSLPTSGAAARLH